MVYQNIIEEQLWTWFVHVERCDLFQQCWVRVVITAVYLKNRITNSLNKEKSLYKLFYGKKPSLKHIKIFGSKIFIHNSNPKSKLNDRKIESKLVGYSESAKGKYIVIIMQEKKSFLSWNITFFEFQITALNIIITNKKETKRPTITWFTKTTTPLKEAEQKKSYKRPYTVLKDFISKESTRLKEINKDVSKMFDFIYLSNKKGTKKITNANLMEVEYNELKHLIMTQITYSKDIKYTTETSSNYQEVVKCKEWRQAIQEKYDSLIRNKTWKATKLSKI